MTEINPTITKEEFESLGFRQYHFCENKKDGGAWSVYYLKDLNKTFHYDRLEVKWFCGTQRYEIYRETSCLMHMPQFIGFLNNKQELEFILERLDLKKFYEITLADKINDWCYRVD